MRFSGFASLTLPGAPGKNITLVVLGRVVEGLATLALLAVLARHGGRQTIGDFYGVRAAALLIYACSEVGLSRYAVNYLAMRPCDYPAFQLNLVFVRAFAFSLASAIFVATTGPLRTTDQFGILLPFFLGGLLLAAISDTLFDAVRAEQVYSPPVVASMLQRLAFAGAGCVIVASGRSFLWLGPWFVVTMLFQMGFGFLTVLRLRGHFLLRISWRRIRAIATGLSPFALVAILGTLNARADVLILYTRSTADEVGSYGGAAYLVESLLLFFYAANAAVFPNFVRLRAWQVPEFAAGAVAMLKGIVAVSLPVCVALILGARAILDLLYGIEFDGDSAILIAFAVVGLLACVNAFYTIALQASSRSRLAAGLMLLLLIVHVAASVALAPRLGALGAVLGLLLAEAALLAIHVAVAGRIVGLWFPWQGTLKCLWGVLAGTGIALVLWPVVHHAGVLIAATVYVLTIVKLQVFAESERAWFAKAALGGFGRRPEQDSDPGDVGDAMNRNGLARPKL